VAYILHSEACWLPPLLLQKFSIIHDGTDETGNTYIINLTLKTKPNTNSKFYQKIKFEFLESVESPNPQNIVY